MSQFTCLIQERSEAHERQADLERRLADHHAGFYPGEGASVRWVHVPSGYMFTEGRPSTSSVISCAIAHPTTRDGREAYMRGISDIWTAITGCTDHEIVVSITETEPPSED